MNPTEEQIKSSAQMITKLSHQKRTGYYNVYINDQFICGISEADLVRLGLHKGQILQTSQIRDLKSQTLMSKHYALALNYLSYRIRTQKEVEDHLKRKGIDQSIIDQIISKLRKEHYLDDTDFAGRWADMRFKQHRSMRSIQVELIKKGIDRQTIQTVLADYQQADQQSALQITEKKRAAGKSDDYIKSFLAQRGFSYVTTQSAITTDKTL